MQVKTYVSKLRAARRRRRMLNKTLSKLEVETEMPVYPAGAQLQRDAIERLGTKWKATNEEERSSI